MPKVDVNEVRSSFRKFSGEARFRQFVRAVSQSCPKKGRIFYWQEKLWDEFISTNASAFTSEDDILEAFRICDVHGCELETPPSEDSSAEIRDTPEYNEAFRTLFPLAASRYWVCPQCRVEHQRWISENAEHCRILRQQT